MSDPNNTHSAPKVQAPQSCGKSTNAMPFYRSFNAARFDHWYTPDVSQINNFNPKGWALEGVTGMVFLTQEPGTTPFYRLYNYTLKDNFYTISPSEKAAAEANGYVTDATSSPVSYIYPTHVHGSIPLYRLYHSAKHDNFYTTSDAERSEAIAHGGYHFVEIAGYILPLGCAAPE
ncbi:hypothetical protein MSAN_00472800 [Mycena sanguinolenta]|uniref:DUF5648 domain-containing protein n=1 Tax=Mycena sanguinolenta TaxID=230812 RepID=A0A8H6ZEG1_9AGAR|nr:hypothetical protein MSAN_00472800 [Mycena sanguinolenta]